MQLHRIKSIARCSALLSLAAAAGFAQPVLTIRHHCEPAGENGVCTTAVTKDEFDALVQALDPKMPEASRRSLAAEYSRLLIMVAEARRRGLDQLPEVQTLLKFSALQVLSTRLVKDISVAPPRISSEEVENYFREHVNDYQEVSLSRIFVPAQKDNAAAAARAEAVRARAVNGEDFAALQRQVASPEAAAPNVRLGPMPCSSLPETHRHVCGLEPGEVSMAVADNFGYSIYRLESRSSRGLEKVSGEIRAALERQNIQGEIQRVRTPVSLELDARYFGELPKPDLAHQHGLHFPAAKSTHSHQH